MMLSLFTLIACRPEPIEYPYNTTTTLDTGSEEVDLFAGPDPYEDGESRLSLGVFYESGYSEIIPVDEESSFFYIWITEDTAAPTFSQTPTTDRIEGNVADEISAGQYGWFGGGVSWNIAQDMTAWTTLYVSVKSSDEVLSAMQVGMGGNWESGGSCFGSGTKQNWVDLAEYGFETDGEWHHLAIPVEDFAFCMNLEQVVEPFSLLNSDLSPDDEGAQILIDNVYFTGE